LAPAFPFHQGSNRPEAGFGALTRKRLVQNKMSAYLEAASESKSGVNQDDADGAVIRRSSFCGPEHAAGFLWAGTIHNDRFETLASEFADGGVGGVTMLHCDLKVAKDAAQDTHGLIIGAYE